MTTERELRQSIHSAIIGEFLRDPHWISTASDEDKQRLWNTSGAIIEALRKQHGFEPDGTVMAVVHHPRRELPEDNVVTFSEIEYPHLARQEVDVDRFGNRGPGPTRFVPEVSEWLDANAPGWSVEWDRSDWGQGWYVAHLHLPSRRQVGEFLERWGKSPAC